MASNKPDTDSGTDDDERQKRIDDQKAQAANALTAVRRALDLTAPAAAASGSADPPSGADDAAADDATTDTSTSQTIGEPRKKKSRRTRSSASASANPLPGSDDDDVDETDTSTQPIGEPRKKKSRPPHTVDDSDSDEEANVKLKNPILWEYFTLQPKAANWQKYVKNKKGDVVRRYPKAVCQVVIQTRHRSKVCDAVLSRADATTSNMRQHLETQHPGAYSRLVLEEKDYKKSKDDGNKDKDKARSEIDEFNDMRMGKFFVLTFVTSFNNR